MSSLRDNIATIHFLQLLCLRCRNNRDVFLLCFNNPKKWNVELRSPAYRNGFSMAWMIRMCLWNYRDNKQKEEEWIDHKDKIYCPLNHLQSEERHPDFTDKILLWRVEPAVSQSSRTILSNFLNSYQTVQSHILDDNNVQNSFSNDNTHYHLSINMLWLARISISLLSLFWNEKFWEDLMAYFPSYDTDYIEKTSPIFLLLLHLYSLPR